MPHKASVDRSVLEGKAIVLFRAAIKSKWTLDPYERRLVHFLKWYGKNCDEFILDAKTDKQSTENKIIDFIQEKKGLVNKQIISSGTVLGFLKAIRLLLEMNDVNINWTKIRRITPRARKYALDRAPTDEEVRKTVENSDSRLKALTLVFVSSGIREGAIEYLKVGDLSPIEKEGSIIAGRLVVYAEEPEQYITFITAEAYNAVQEYLNFRQMHGDIFTKRSPLFRDKFDPIADTHHRKIHNTNISKPIPMSGAAIRKYYNYLFHELGFRDGPKKRHEFSVHSFRKYFKTKSELAGMKPINVETLMGHSTGISDSYYRPTEREILQEYIQAIPHLTISQEKKLKEQVEKLKVENAEIEVMKRSYIDMKLELEKTNHKMAKLYKEMYSKGIIKTD